MERAKKKILLVDDNDDIREVMTAILSSAGYDVMTAASGTEAIALAHKDQPDLILMDIKMPGMDGEQTTDALKSSSTTAHIPIAYLSNLIAAKEVHDGHVAGSKIGDIYFIPKAYPPEKIIEMVERVLLAK